MGPKRNIYAIYTSQDKGLAHDLLRHLQLLEKDFNVSIWHDNPIYPKQHWKPQNASRINQADIFLLLVSDTFMHSEFIQQDEFKMVIDRYKAGESIVIPILLDNCPWDIEFNSDDYDFSFKELQVLPEDRKPISEWNSADEAFKHVIDRVKGKIAPIGEDTDLKIPNENLEEKSANAIREKQTAINFTEESKANSKAKEENRLRVEAEAKKSVDEEKKLKEETEAKKRAEQEIKGREEAQAKKRNEEDKMGREETEAKKRVDEEKKLEEEVEVKRIALEDEKLKEKVEAKKKAEQELKLGEDAKTKIKAEEEKRDKEEAESKRIALKEERLREETQAKKRAEEEKRGREEAEAKSRAEEEKRLTEEDEAKRIASEEIKIKDEAQAKKREAAEYWEKGDAIRLQHADESYKDDEETQDGKNKTTKKRVLVGLVVATLTVAGIWFFNTGQEKPAPTLPNGKATTIKGPNASAEPKVESGNQGASELKRGVGDNYEGGIIFTIDTSGKSGKIAAVKDAGPMPWEKANSIHEQLGEGWRLPTLDELRLMYRTIGQGASNSGEFADELYWSSTPYDTYQARLLRFRDGNASYHYNKGVVNRKFHVRAVRDFSR